jgi:hypothetical protein
VGKRQQLADGGKALSLIAGEFRIIDAAEVHQLLETKGRIVAQLAHRLEIVRHRNSYGQLTERQQRFANAIAEALLQLPTKTFQFGAHGMA